MTLPMGRDVALKKLAGFSGIGVINTLLHTLVVITLVELFASHPVTANIAGFALANTFSYFANSRWNFKAPLSLSRYGRFFVVSLASLGLTIAISGFAVAAGWHYLAGLALLFVAMPLLTFISHWQWTFKRH